MEDKRRTPTIQSTSNRVRMIMMMKKRVIVIMLLKNKISVEPKGQSKDRKTNSKMIQVKKMTRKVNLNLKVKYLKISQSNLLKVEDQEEDLQRHQMLILIQDKRPYLSPKLQDPEEEEDHLPIRPWISSHTKLQNKADLKEQSLET